MSHWHGRVAETLNFGVSGYGTAQEYLSFRHDAANNHPTLNPTDYSDQSPYFTSGDGRLELNTSFREVLAANAAQPRWRQLRIKITDRYRTAQLVHQLLRLASAVRVSTPKTPMQRKTRAPTPDGSTMSRMKSIDLRSSPKSLKRGRSLRRYWWRWRERCRKPVPSSGS